MVHIQLSRVLRNKPTALTAMAFKEPIRPIAGILTAVDYIGTAPGYLACVLIFLTIADEDTTAFLARSGAVFYINVRQFMHLCLLDKVCEQGFRS